ncbi:MAG: hypothetical protein GX577_16570, partial [Leptolinea sp.]|nr:hypothetical protein [Leptolinea sp.]
MANDSDVKKTVSKRITEWFSSLNGRLTLLFLAMSIIPMMIMGAITYFQSLPQLKADVYEEFDRLALMQKESIEN